jgi:hypothetical protein
MNDAGGSELDWTAAAFVGCGWLSGFVGVGVSGLPAFGFVGVSGLLVSDCEGVDCNDGVVDGFVVAS